MNTYMEFLSGICLIEVNKHYLNRLISIIRNILLRNPLPTGFEKHHIVPKSWGGDNEKDNVIRLTSKEHFVVHHLMTKAFPKDRPMALSYWLLSKGHIINSREYDRVKRMVGEGMSERMSGRPSWNKGILLSDEHKEKMSIAKKGKPWSEKRRKSHNLGLGKRRKPPILTEEQRAQKSQRMRENPPSKRIDVRHLLSDLKRGKIWINNGIMSKMIAQEEYDIYYQNGYILGRGNFMRCKRKCQ